jgi:V/A-type H+-transporting ATPase subunit I
MVRVQLLLLTKDARGVLCQLGAAGILHLDEKPVCQAGMLPDGAERLQARGDVEKLAVRLEQLQQDLAPFRPPSDGTKTTILTVAQVAAWIARIEEQLGDLPERHRQQTQLLLTRQAACAEAELLRDVNRPAETPAAPGLLHFLLGSLPASAPLPAEITRQSLLIPLALAGNRQRVVVIAQRSAAAALMPSLSQAGFQSSAWATNEALTLMGRAERQRAYEQAQAALQATTEKIREIAAAFASGWGAAAITLQREQCLLSVETRLPHTAATIISGWVPQAALTGLTHDLQETTGGHHLLTATAPALGAQGQETPVRITHRPLLRPFAALVRAFGLPHYGQADPTFFAAVSFMLMFGMMFGDAGHGLVLMATGLLLLAHHRTGRWHDAGVLLTSTGGASICFGLVYGSFFGLECARHWALWRDPLAGNPNQLMWLALCVGSALITIGLLLNIFNLLRRHDLPDAILGGYGLAGLLFYWGALWVVTRQKQLHDNPGLAYTAALTLAIPLAAWIFRPILPRGWRTPARQGRAADLPLAGQSPVLPRPHERAAERCAAVTPSDTTTDAEPAWLSGLAESLVATFETVLSFLANTISFIRLAAYAMSHAALLLAVVLLADAVRPWPGGAGWAVGVLVLGNLGALVLEGLIAAMQALRLEYYEFFSKFYDGGGKPFHPFCLP